MTKLIGHMTNVIGIIESRICQEIFGSKFSKNFIGNFNKGKRILKNEFFLFCSEEGQIH